MKLKVFPLTLKEAFGPTYRVRLNEATNTKARTGIVKKSGNGEVLAKIIEPGQGASGFYTPEVLQRAVDEKLFDDIPIFKNHPGTGQRTEMPDIDLAVGYIKPGSWYDENGPKGPGVYGHIGVLGPYRDLVGSLADTPFGLSIHADGDLEREGDRTSRVLYISKVHSVDLVVKPGAGGAVVEVLESERFDPAPPLYPLGEEPMKNQALILQEANRMLNQQQRGRRQLSSRNAGSGIFQDGSGNNYVRIGNSGLTEAQAFRRWAEAGCTGMAGWAARSPSRKTTTTTRLLWRTARYTSTSATWVRTTAASTKRTKRLTKRAWKKGPWQCGLWAPRCVGVRQ